MDIPIGLNLAIAASRYPIIIRVDAHTELAPGYTTRGVDALERTGAASLGGIMVATGKPGFQAAVAHAYNSRFGLGGGAYHGETAHRGSGRVGVHGHLPARRARRGRRLRRDPAPRRGLGAQLPPAQGRPRRVARPRLRVSYWPRSDAKRLARQFRATGIWRGELVRRLGRGNSVRFFAPPVLLLTLVLSVIAIPLHATGVLQRRGSAGSAPSSTSDRSRTSTLLIVAAISGDRIARRPAALRRRARDHAPQLGAGFIVGLVRGAGDAVDTSRTES